MNLIAGDPSFERSQRHTKFFRGFCRAVGSLTCVVAHRGGIVPQFHGVSQHHPSKQLFLRWDDRINALPTRQREFQNSGKVCLNLNGVLVCIPSSIEIECPRQRLASRGAHEPRSFQHRAHAFGRVNKGPKFVAC